MKNLVQTDTRWQKNKSKKDKLFLQLKVKQMDILKQILSIKR